MHGDDFAQNPDAADLIERIREVALDRRAVLAWQPSTDAELVAVLRDAAHSATRDLHLDFAR